MSGHGISDEEALLVVGHALNGDQETAAAEFATQVSLAAMHGQLEQRAAELYTALAVVLLHYAGEVMGLDLREIAHSYDAVKPTDYDMRPLDPGHPSYRLKRIAGTIVVAAWNRHTATLAANIAAARAEGLLVKAAEEIAYSLFSVWAELAIRAEFPELHAS